MEVKIDDIVKSLYHPIPSPLKVFDELWRQQVQLNWTVETLGSELEIDKQVYPTLQLNLKNVIFKLAVYFSVVDFFAQKVASKLSQTRFDELHISILFGYVTHIEGVHADMYSRFLDMIFTDDRARVPGVIDQIMKSQAAVDIFEWGKTYAESQANDIRPLIIAMICYEGLMLRPFFAIPCAIKSVRNILPGFLKGNEMVGRDEYYHMHNYIALYLYVCSTKGKLDSKRVISQISRAVELAENQFDELIDQDIPEWKIVKAEQKGFARLTANIIFEKIGVDYALKTSIKTEPEYMQSLGAFQITSFHAIAPSEYAMPSSEGIDMANMY